jgi:hypothetical protein
MQKPLPVFRFHSRCLGGCVGPRSLPEQESQPVLLLHKTVLFQGLRQEPLRSNCGRSARTTRGNLKGAFRAFSAVKEDDLQGLHRSELALRRGLWSSCEQWQCWWEAYFPQKEHNLEENLICDELYQLWVWGVAANLLLESFYLLARPLGYELAFHNC